MSRIVNSLWLLEPFYFTIFLFFLLFFCISLYFKRNTNRHKKCFVANLNKLKFVFFCTKFYKYFCCTNIFFIKKLKWVFEGNIKTYSVRLETMYNVVIPIVLKTYEKPYQTMELAGPEPELRVHQTLQCPPPPSPLVTIFAASLSSWRIIFSRKFFRKEKFNSGNVRGFPGLIGKKIHFRISSDLRRRYPNCREKEVCSTERAVNRVKKKLYNNFYPTRSSSSSNQKWPANSTNPLQRWWVFFKLEGPTFLRTSSSNAENFKKCPCKPFFLVDTLYPFNTNRKFRVVISNL